MGWDTGTRTYPNGPVDPEAAAEHPGLDGGAPLWREAPCIEKLNNLSALFCTVANIKPVVASESLVLWILLAAPQTAQFLSHAGGKLAFAVYAVALGNLWWRSPHPWKHSRLCWIRL